MDFCMMDTFFLDTAAAKLCIEEAGGTCKRADGGEIVPSYEHALMRIVAINGILAASLCL